MEEALPQRLRRAGARCASSSKALPRHAGHRVHRQQGKLFMLQTRSGKRTAPPALRDRGRDGAGGPDRRATRRSCASIRVLDQLLHPTLDPRRARTLLAQGPAGQPGRRVGRGRVHRRRGRERAPPRARAVILVRIETTPEDIHGMKAARGHPDRARRHDQPRRGRRARHGPALRRRRRRRCASTTARRRSSAGGTHGARRRDDHARRRDRRGLRRRGRR